MKTLITILTFVFCLGGIMAQNADGPGRAIPQKTPELKALYAQQHNLKKAGDVVGLETNRQAMIAAWQYIDPTIAAEFKPNLITEVEPFISKTFQNASNSNNNKPLWGDDIMIYSGVVDGVDIDTALDGTIYVADYEKLLNNDILRISKSTDNGVSFSNLTTQVFGPQDLKKIKLTIMDKGPDKFIFVTYCDFDGSLVNMRFDIGGGPLNTMSEIIATDVKDFDVDLDYEYQNAAQMYAVYIKTNQNIYSARSLANSSGFGWGDEHNFHYFARECAITYGKDNTFMSFVGLNSGNLYFISNSGYNDPTGWSARLDVTDGSIMESTDISLSAERKEFADYRALLLASQRTTGSTEDYVGVANIIQGEIAFPQEIIGAGDVRTWDSWSRKQDGNTIIKTSYAKTDGDFCSVKNYHDADWDNSVWVSDDPITVQRGSSAVAEDIDGNAIAVYIGADRTGLYFDSSNNTASILENPLNSFLYYPNPTNSILTLQSESLISNVAIFNLLGQQVLTQNLETLSTDLDVSSLSSGTYVMKVIIGSETGSYKIIKN